VLGQLAAEVVEQEPAQEPGVIVVPEGRELVEGREVAHGGLDLASGREQPGGPVADAVGDRLGRGEPAISPRSAVCHVWTAAAKVLPATTAALAPPAMCATTRFHGRVSGNRPSRLVPIARSSWVARAN
jgi:hypothetical protein